MARIPLLVTSSLLTITSALATTSPTAPFDASVARGHVYKRPDPVQDPDTESEFYIQVTSLPANADKSIAEAAIGKRVELEFVTTHQGELQEKMEVGFRLVPTDGGAHATKLQWLSGPKPAPKP